MRARHLITLSLASTALAAGNPVSAQMSPDMSAQGGPAPAVTYEEHAIVQPIGPGAERQTRRKDVAIERRVMPGDPAETQHFHDSYPVYPGAPYTAPDYPAPGNQTIPMAGAPIYFMPGGFGSGAMAYSAPLQSWQSDAAPANAQWLADCQLRYRGHNKKKRQETDDWCAAYLARFAEGHHRVSYGYGPVMLVPVMVPIPQRAVEHEYVTQEWVEETKMVPAPVRMTPSKRVPIKPSPSKLVPVKPAQLPAGKYSKTK